MEAGLGPGDFVFDGNPVTPRKKAHPPSTPTRTQFLAYVDFGKAAGWIKMLIGTEVKDGSGDVVLDGIAAPPLP